MIRCDDCGWVGEFEELKKVFEPRGEFWGAPCFETMTYCPCCGSDDLTDCVRGDEEDDDMA